MKRTLLIPILGLLTSLSALAAGGHSIKLIPANVDRHDPASLQRGAQLYINYCMGCHSIKYMRYNRLAKDLRIVDEKGQVDDELLKRNLIFDKTHTVNDTITNSMQNKDAAKWFGVAPPDLSVITRVRGADWLYSYLMSFYVDKSRPWGVNNLVFKETAMPGVLVPLQGTQMPVFRTEIVNFGGSSKEVQVVDHVQLVEPGSMSPQEFEVAMHDLVNFLAYVAEPYRVTQTRIGIGVLLFLLALLIVVYLLKKEYWKDVH